MATNFHVLSPALRQLLLAFLLLSVTGCLLRPPDVVDVTATHGPPTNGRFVIVVQAHGKFEPMDFALYGFGLWERVNARFLIGGPVDSKKSATYSTRVFWTNGDKVGVVTTDARDGWTVHWFSSPKTKRVGSWLLYGGNWCCDLNDADEVKPMTDDEIRLIDPEHIGN